MENKDILNEKEIKTVTSILGKLTPGFLPLDIFLSITRLWTSAIAELVPLRIDGNGELMVLLSERPANDTYWPNMLHTPGTFVLPTDKDGDLKYTFDRLFAKELSDLQIMFPPIFSHYHLSKTKRGAELSLVHFTEYDSVSDGFVEMNVENITPDKVIDHQIGFIQEASNDFRNMK